MLQVLLKLTVEKTMEINLQTSSILVNLQTDFIKYIFNNSEEK